MKKESNPLPPGAIKPNPPPSPPSPNLTEDARRLMVAELIGQVFALSHVKNGLLDALKLVQNDLPAGLSNAVNAAIIEAEKPIHCAPPLDMVLHCPKCHVQHIDAPDPMDCPATGPDGEPICEYCGNGPRWTNPPHKSHLCVSCGHVWRPADVPTNGVKETQTKGKNDS